MNRLIVVAMFAVGVLSACGGPIDEEQGPQPAASTSSELRTEAPPPLQPAEDPNRPMQILGVDEPLIVFDLSNGRINARLTMPPPEERALYQTHLMGGRCGCH